jgi:signal transduction histidine kinase
MIKKHKQNYKVLLGGGFTLLFLTAIIGGSLIVFFGAHIQADIQSIQRNYEDGVRRWGEIETNMNLLRVFVRDYVYTSAPESRSSLHRQIFSESQTITRLLVEYNTSMNFSDPEGIFPKYIEAFDKYKNGVEEVLKVAQIGNQVAAGKMMIEKLGLLRNKLDEMSQTLFGENEQIANTINHDVDALQAKFLWISISILAASIVTGTFIYSFVVRSFQSYVVGITDVQNEKEKLLDLLTDRQKMIEKLIIDMESSVEEERKRFAQELHDAIGHGLTMSILHIESAMMEMQASAPNSMHSLESTIGSIKEVLAETKRISYELRPPLLDDFGLTGAIKQLARDFQNKTKIKMNVAIDQDIPRLSPRQEISLFRVVQETLTNVEKHSRAATVTLQLLFREGGTLALSIIDDGCGFDATVVRSDTNHHLGLRNIRERINLMNGDLIINSFPHKGTEIIVEVPVQKEMEEA